MVLQLTQQGWKDSYRSFVRHKTGNPTARLGSNAYPWRDTITLVEAESSNAADDLTVPTADVRSAAAGCTAARSAAERSAAAGMRAHAAWLMAVG